MPEFYNHHDDWVHCEIYVHQDDKIYNDLIYCKIYVHHDDQIYVSITIHSYWNIIEKLRIK